VPNTPADWSLVADGDEALVVLDLATAVRGVPSLDQSPASQAIPLVERDLHLGRLRQGARLAAGAAAADRKERSRLQLREPRAARRRDFVLRQGPAFGDHRIAVALAHNSRAARARLDGMAWADKNEVGLAVCGGIFGCRDENTLATIGSALTVDAEKVGGLGIGHGANLVARALERLPFVGDMPEATEDKFSICEAGWVQCVAITGGVAAQRNQTRRAEPAEMVVGR
jgi:hypothetical protein